MSNIAPQDDNNKKVLIAIIVAVVVLLLVTIPTVIVLLQDDGGGEGSGSGGDSVTDNDEIDPDDYTDTDETIKGTYTLSIEAGITGSASYAFDGNNVIHKYTSKEGELITVEYTYVIAKNGRGDKIIKFTDISTEETKHHEFYTGTYIDQTPFISINDSWYFLQSESEK